MRTRCPLPQTQLCHSRHGHRGRALELRESVEQSHPHMQLHPLTLPRARLHPLAHAVVGDLDGPTLQRVRVHALVHLAPLPSVPGPVLLAFALAFAQKLDACAVDEQVQWRGAAGGSLAAHADASGVGSPC